MVIVSENYLPYIENILASDVVAFDTETTGLNVRRDKVIGFSLSNGEEHCYVSHLEWANNQHVINISYDKCKEILSTLTGKKLLTFNGAFDTSIVLQYFGIDLTPYIEDVMLLAHTCLEEQDFSLKGMARNILGVNTNEQTVLKEQLKLLGTKDYYKIPLSIMVPYAEADAKLTYSLHSYWMKNISEKLLKLFNEEVMPVYKTVVIPMMRTGVKLDIAKMRQDLADITKDITAVEDEIQQLISYYLLPFKQWFYDKEYPMKTRGKLFSLQKWNPTLSLREVQQLAFKNDGGVYEFNISSDIHLRKLFFETLSCTPLSYTDGGLPRADAEFLESVATKYDFVPKMIVYNKLNKIKSTYITRLLDESEDGIFYPTYFMHRTISGRLSGDAQQLPRPLESGDARLVKYTNAIRAYFVSRPDKVFIGTDYESLEPKCFASESGDQALQNIFLNGDDFYSTIAIAVEGLEGSSNKKAENYLGKINKAARQKAKAYSLGIAYGMDDYKLHKDLEIPQQEAKRLVDGYLKSFPNLAKRMEEVRNRMLSQGTAETKFGRVRNQIEVPGLYLKHGKCILNALDLWSKYNETPGLYANAKKDYKVVRHALNNALNFGIQGLAGHIINRASIEIAKRLPPGAAIVAQIHDELIIECNLTDKEYCARLIQECMETTTKIDVPLVAEPAFGFNFKEAK